jgi:hypothetical protein
MSDIRNYDIYFKIDWILAPIHVQGLIDKAHLVVVSLCICLLKHYEMQFLIQKNMPYGTNNGQRTTYNP